MRDQEVVMARLIKTTGFRVAQWFRHFRAKNRPARRWYETDIGLG
jgi:hypothetical protein